MSDDTQKCSRNDGETQDTCKLKQASGLDELDEDGENFKKNSNEEMLKAPIRRSQRKKKASVPNPRETVPFKHKSGTENLEGGFVPNVQIADSKPLTKVDSDRVNISSICPVKDFSIQGRSENSSGVEICLQPAKDNEAANKIISVNSQEKGSIGRVHTESAEVETVVEQDTEHNEDGIFQHNATFQAVSEKMDTSREYVTGKKLLSDHKYEQTKVNDGQYDQTEMSAMDEVCSTEFSNTCDTIINETGEISRSNKSKNVTWDYKQKLGNKNSQAAEIIPVGQLPVHTVSPSIVRVEQVETEVNVHENTISSEKQLPKGRSKKATCEQCGKNFPNVSNLTGLLAFQIYITD